MHGLRHKAKAQGGRLLRVLFLRLGSVSANSSSARRRAGCCLLLCVAGDDQHADPNLAPLAWQCAHQLAGVVDAQSSHSCRFVCSCVCSRRDLDHRRHLDGHGVPIEREAVQSHALPLHRPLLSCDDRTCVRIGHGVVSAGIYGWISLGLFIVGGSGLIWWATERTWGKFS